MSANVETMFYVREKPWHGLGTRIEEAPTSADALVYAGLDWTVEQKDVYCQRRCDFAIFRRTRNVRKRRVKVCSL